MFNTFTKLTKKSNSTRQHGFTLIELMVVVVIMAIMLSVVVLSLESSSSNRLKTFAEKTNNYIILACDQAAMRSEVVFIKVDKQGLNAGLLQSHDSESIDDKTKFSSIIKPLEWIEGISVDWVLPLNSQNSLELEEDEKIVGWNCWPSGEIEEGEIIFKPEGYLEELEEEDSKIINLKWDSWGRPEIELNL